MPAHILQIALRVRAVHCLRSFLDRLRPSDADALRNPQRQLASDRNMPACKKNRDIKFNRNQKEKKHKHQRTKHKFFSLSPQSFASLSNTTCPGEFRDAFLSLYSFFATRGKLSRICNALNSIVK